MQSISTGLRTSSWLTGSRLYSRALDNITEFKRFKMYVWKVLCIAKSSDKELHTTGKEAQESQHKHRLSGFLDAMHACQWTFSFPSPNKLPSMKM